jgi:hypothetical protein
LIDLFELVKCNPALDTPAVVSLLRTCVDSTQDLEKILKKFAPKATDSSLVKLKKGFVSLIKEDEVAKIFQSLEQKKSSLSLCILNIDSYVVSSFNSKAFILFYLLSNPNEARDGSSSLLDCLISFGYQLTA